MPMSRSMTTLTALAVSSLIGTHVFAQSTGAAAERPGLRAAPCVEAGLPAGQRLVVQIENEKARLGAQGFSPLRDFPAPEIGWSCWR